LELGAEHFDVLLTTLRFLTRKNYRCEMERGKGSHKKREERKINRSAELPNEAPKRDPQSPPNLGMTKPSLSSPHVKSLVNQLKKDESPAVAEGKDESSGIEDPFFYEEEGKSIC
jgi:hypothetical protein